MRKKLYIVFFSLIAVLAGLYIGSNYSRLIKTITNNAITDNIFYTSFDNGRYYSVVNSRSEVVVLDDSGTWLNNIVPNEDACINGVIADSGNNNIYIWCTYFDESGSYIALEEVLLYSDDGKLQRTVISKEHERDDAVSASGRIKSLTILENGNLGLAAADSLDITILEIDKTEDTIVSINKLPYENASTTVLDICCYKDINNIYFTTKHGKVIRAGEGQETVFDIGTEGVFVPSKIQAASDGSLLIKESFRGCIIGISPEGESKVLLEANDVGLEEITSFYVSDGRLLISDNNQIIRYAYDGGGINEVSRVSKLSYSISGYAVSYMLLALAVTAIILILIFIKKLVTNLSKDNRSILKQALLIGISLLLTASVVSYYIFEALEERAVQANYNLLMIHFEYLSEILDTEKLEEIQNVSQFDSEAFNYTVDKLNRVLMVNNAQDHSKYVGIIKQIEGKTVTITYHDQDEYFFTPVFSEYEKNGMYRPIFEEGETLKNISDDAEGMWQYVAGPIYSDDGRVIAVAEIGFDVSPYSKANSELLTDLLLKLVSILAVIMLLLIEITIYDNKVAGKKAVDEKTQEDLISVSAGSVRAVSVLIFIAVYLNSTFMPVYSSNLYQDILGLPKDIVIAMPIVTESVFLIITIFVFSKLRRKVNLRSAIAGGGIIYAAGNIATAFSYSTIYLTASRAVAGIGYGIMYVALRAYIASSDEELSGEELIAYSAGMTCGLSVGGVLGSIVADFAGFRNTFIIIAIIILAACLTARKILVPRYSEHGEEDNSFIRFFVNKEIIVYYIFEFLPAAVCGSFMLYFLPLIADRLGYSTALVGQIFLLNALFAIYSGPALTKATTGLLGAKKSLIVAGFIYAIAIFIVAFNPSSIGIIALAAIIIGVVDSFKENQESEYFLSLDSCKRVGETRAVSYFGIFECSGEAFGPLAYAFILSMGISQGLMVLGIILPVSVIIFSRLGGGRTNR